MFQFRDNASHLTMHCLFIEQKGYIPLSSKDSDFVVTMASSTLACYKCSQEIETVSQNQSIPNTHLCASCDGDATEASIEAACESISLALAELEEKAANLFEDFLEASEEADTSIEMVILLRKQARCMAVDTQITQLEMQKVEIRIRKRKAWEERWGKKWSEKA